MKSVNRRTVTIASDTTVSELYRWLGTIPETAKLSVSTSPGDRPWESSTSSLTAVWTAE
jgi:hypothetical protein